MHGGGPTTALEDEPVMMFLHEMFCVQPRELARAGLETCLVLYHKQQDRLSCRGASAAAASLVMDEDGASPTAAALEMDEESDFCMSLF